MNGLSEIVRNGVLIICVFVMFSMNESFAQKIQLERPSINRLTRPITLFANYSYFELWIPNKYGASLALNTRNNVTWELEYLTGSIGIDWSFLDIGKFEEKKISLIRRKFKSTSSFNYFIGLTYSEVGIKIGNEIINRIVAFDGTDSMELSRLNVTLGLGNRWARKNGLVFSFDWVGLNIPVYNFDVNKDFIYQTLDPEDADNVDKTLKYLQNIPGLMLLKFQLGYSF